jgi:twinkle protein
LRQLACHHLYQNTPVFVCSLEERPRDVFLRHCLCALGTDNPSMDALQWCADTWLETLKIWNYSARDSDAEHVKILAAIRVLARDFGVRHAIIDNLMSLDVSANDVEAQRRFSIKLTQTCELSGVHLHLVAHPRKRSRTDQAHTMEDVAGSADLSRKADNIVFVRRAKDENSVSSADVTPMMAEVMKQRWGTGWTGPLSGWYHRKLRQFQIDQFAELPTRYLCDEAYKARFAAEPLFS